MTATDHVVYNGFRTEATTQIEDNAVAALLTEFMNVTEKSTQAKRQFQAGSFYLSGEEATETMGCDLPFYSTIPDYLKILENLKI